MMKFKATKHANDIAIEALTDSELVMILKRTSMNNFSLTLYREGDGEPLFTMQPFALAEGDMFRLEGVNCDIEIERN